MRTINLAGEILLIAAAVAVTAPFDDQQSETSSFGVHRRQHHANQTNSDNLQNADHLYKFQFTENENHSSESLTAKAGSTNTNEARSPRIFSLYQNYPNPFNARTFIKFEIVKETFITLEIFDARGKKITRLMAMTISKGFYLAPWNGDDDDGHRMTSGIYYARLSDGNVVDIKRMVLLR